MPSVWGWVLLHERTDHLLQDVQRGDDVLEGTVLCGRFLLDESRRWSDKKEKNRLHRDAGIDDPGNGPKRAEKVLIQGDAR